MRVLLDECIDWRLFRDILGHDVKTARQMGWTSIKNGDLLALAAEGLCLSFRCDRHSVIIRHREARKRRGDPGGWIASSGRALLAMTPRVPPEREG